MHREELAGSGLKGSLAPKGPASRWLPTQRLFSISALLCVLCALCGKFSVSSVPSPPGDDPKLAPVPPASKPLDAALPAAEVLRQVETDWLVQAMTRAGLPLRKKGALPPRWEELAAAAGTFQGPFPTADSLARARALAADLARSGVDVSGAEKALDEAARLGDPREAYLAARRAWRRLAFSDPLLGFDRLLFVKRFTQETYPDVCLNHMPWVSRPGGDLCVLSAPGGLFRALAEGRPVTLRAVLNGALGPGHVHGMDLDWDGGRVVSGYARTPPDQPHAGWLNRAESGRLRKAVEPIHLFEVGADGRGLRQLTRGEWSDLDPAILPGGDVAFVSERCGFSLQCNEYDKDETSCNLYVMRPDGSGVRRMSVNKDGDYLPHAFDNGLLGYTRWEYHERGWAYIQSIWTVRPDGTGADALFKQHLQNPWALYDARSIPGSHKMSALAGGHHTLYAGPVVVVDADRGLNNPAGIAIVTPAVKPQEGGMAGTPVPEGGVPEAGGLYMTPWPLSEKRFLVSHSYRTLPMDRTDPEGFALYLIDVFGTKELVYRDPAISCSSPIPLRPRPRPPVIPDTRDAGEGRAVCVATDAGYGVPGVPRERVRYLRIAEPVGWPYDNAHGGRRYGEKGPTMVNWTPVRILGDVPVEADGSAHFEVPPDTAVYFQLLDENRMELRRMRSFISFQPGERRGCVGCHETRVEAPVSGPGIAAERPPSRYLPAPWGDRPVSFLRDLQPILDRHCVRCHAGLKPAGGLDYSGGLTTYEPRIAGYGHNRAYDTIVGKRLVAFSDVHAQDASVTPPLAYGSRRRKLVETLGKAPHTERAELSPEEWLTLVMWIDANAPYHDGFVDKRPERPAYDPAGDKALQKGLQAVHERRCAACHKPAEVTRIDWIDLREPARSRFLAAPLARAAGGLGACGEVYKDGADADYREALGLARDAVARLWESPRRDVRSLKESGAPPPR